MSAVYIIGGAALEINGAPNRICRLRDSNLGSIRIHIGGCGRNIAVKLASLGQTVQFITTLGNDARASAIETDLRQHGLLLDHVFRHDRASAAILNLFDEEHDLLAGINDMDITAALTPDLLAPLLPELNNAPLCVLDANLSRETLCYLTDMLTVPIFFAPISCTKAQRIGSNIGKCHTIRPNRFEAAQLSGCSCDTIRGVYRSAEWFLQQGVRQVFISLGDEGIVYATADSFGHFPGESISVVDTANAGDIMSAIIIDSMLRGESAERCAAIANHAAALYCASIRCERDLL